MAGAERNYIASLDWARHQQAKSWELRAAMSLAKVQPRHSTLLKSVLGQFGEGFATADLASAQGLLAKLAT